MAEIVWAPSADRDLDDVREFIARDSPANTAATIERVRASVGRLEQFPWSGRTVPERPERGLREVIVGDYRAIYRYDESQQLVTMLAVIHGRRLLPALPE